MTFLTSIKTGDVVRPADRLDFSGAPGTFPLAQYDLAKLRNTVSRNEVAKGPSRSEEHTSELQSH